ncbi:transposase, partial [Bacillus pseudomycoides]
NQAKRFAFQMIVREKRWNRKIYTDSLHLVLKWKYQLNDYYANRLHGLLKTTGRITL